MAKKKKQRRITGPGIYDAVPMPDYLAGGLTPAPSLSSGVIHTLTERTPAHAWCEHPALGDRPRKSSKAADFGSAAHAEWLGGEDLALIDAPDYKTKAARAERDQAKADGKIPVLAHDLAKIDSMMTELAIYRDHLGIEGRAEQTIVWEEDGIWFRIRTDLLIDHALPLLQLDRASCWDYKTSANADALRWLKLAGIPLGCDIKAALYLRGIEAVLGERRDFVFLVQETDEPYAVNAIGASAPMLELANEKIDRAKAIWKRCLERDEWPRYGYGITWADVPNYQRFDWEARQIMGTGQ